MMLVATKPELSTVAIAALIQQWCHEDVTNGPGRWHGPPGRGDVATSSLGVGGFRVCRELCATARLCIVTTWTAGGRRDEAWVSYCRIKHSLSDGSKWWSGTESRAGRSSDVNRIKTTHSWKGSLSIVVGPVIVFRSCFCSLSVSLCACVCECVRACVLACVRECVCVFAILADTTTVCLHVCFQVCLKEHHWVAARTCTYPIFSARIIVQCSISSR